MNSHSFLLKEEKKGNIKVLLEQIKMKELKKITLSEQFIDIIDIRVWKGPRKIVKSRPPKIFGSWP